MRFKNGHLLGEHISAFILLPDSANRAGVWFQSVFLGRSGSRDCAIDVFFRTRRKSGTELKPNFPKVCRELGARWRVQGAIGQECWR